MRCNRQKAIHRKQQKSLNESHKKNLQTEFGYKKAHRPGNG